MFQLDIVVAVVEGGGGFHKLVVVVSTVSDAESNSHNPLSVRMIQKTIKTPLSIKEGIVSRCILLLLLLLQEKCRVGLGA